jgi:hypothetical protein
MVSMEFISASWALTSLASEQAQISKSKFLSVNKGTLCHCLGIWILDLIWHRSFVIDSAHTALTFQWHFCL